MTSCFRFVFFSVLALCFSFFFALCKTFFDGKKLSPTGENSGGVGVGVGVGVGGGERAFPSIFPRVGWVFIWRITSDRGACFFFLLRFGRLEKFDWKRSTRLFGGFLFD